MKTKITTFITCLLFSMTLMGQNCVDLTLSTPPWGGDLELNPFAFLQGANTSDTYTLTPSIVNCDNIGTTTIQVNGPNGFTCQATLTLIDDVPPVPVLEPNIVLQLDANGNATLTSEVVDDGSYDACSSITYSLSQTEFTCADAGENLITMTITDEYGNWNQAWTTVTVLAPDDDTPPTILANDYLNVSFDNNGEATITFDMIEEGSGSFDNCGPVTKSLSKTFFTCDDAGEQNVIFTVTDASGNISTELITINFEDKIAPVPFVINQGTAILSTNSGDLVPTVQLFAEDFDMNSYDNCGIVEMTLNKDVFTCEDIGENEIIFTVYDEAGNSDFAITTLTIIDNSAPTTSLACSDAVTYSTFNDLPYTVTPYDLLEGGPYGCDFIFVLEIEDENGDIVPDNHITAEYLGQTLNYTVYDFNTGNSCWGEIIISDEDIDCNFAGEGDINWPLQLIEIDLLGVDVEDLTPEFIASLPGYDLADTYPEIPTECDLIGISYTDEIFTTDGNIDKIIRTFTVLDWVNYNETTGEGLYEFVQVIKNTNSPSTFICDFLPNSAPVGDCESGHTLEDDVEWPDNITIQDHRIEPQELVNYSGIDTEDSQPIFYGDDAGLYEASYDDLVGNLTGEILQINRNWSVTRTDGIEIIWNYVQEIEVQFSEFSNLVAVNTHGNRGVPQVDLGNNFMTDQFGKAIVEDDFFINPELTTDPLNGLDLEDIYLMRQHILAQSLLEEYQIIAGDYSEEGMLTSLDIALVQRVLLGIEEGKIDWRFIDITDTATGVNQIKGHYIAYRLGDVNDSALLPGESEVNLTQEELSFEDHIINSGESYSIPFYSNAMINTSGIELRMEYDPAIIEIDDITSDLFGTDLVWNADADKELLTILVYDIEAAHLLDGSDELFNISIVAKDNNAIHNGLKFSNEYRSFIMDDEFNKYGINGVVENMVGTNNEELAASINIFPNPAVDFITVDLSDTQIDGDYTISLFTTNGLQVATQKNNARLNTTTLPTGSYLLYLTTGDSYYSQMVQVYR